MTAKAPGGAGMHDPSSLPGVGRWGRASGWPFALTLRIPSSWVTIAPPFWDPRPDWNGNLKFRCCVLAEEGVGVLESEPRAPRPLTSPWGYRRALFRGNRIQILLSWALKGVTLNLPVLGFPLIPWLPKSIVEGRLGILHPGWKCP